MVPLFMNNKHTPAKLVTMPTALCQCIVLLKKIAPISMVDIGVKAFKIPVNELSILVSAIQKRKAGKKLPNKPDKIISGNFSFGNFLKCLMAAGIKIIPALPNRSAATWYAVKAWRPIFIKIKELPQITDKARKIPQFIKRSRATIRATKMMN